MTLSRCQFSRSSRTTTTIFVSKRMVPSVLGVAPRFLYVRDVSQVRAWVPGVPGIVEAFHAHFTDHVWLLHL